MRIEHDSETNAVYVYLRDEIPYGAAVRTVEVEEGVYLDVDRRGRALGLEFLDLQDFLGFLERHDGRIEIPGRRVIVVGETVNDPGEAVGEEIRVPVAEEVVVERVEVVGEDVVVGVEIDDQSAHRVP